ncbi:hypothetical protein [Sphingomonas oryzagri]|uniref:Uncharacterized protein n=1 Tax=Sphingomonas oryzagri TaxID=3042314 RepID=A0ABT6N7U0_9SPHN|nr:hypothetical protein [Sphingomonas oryzagri]MDH7641192.1 hypothetical protein [Sphingomonas oryzagri]
MAGCAGHPNKPAPAPAVAVNTESTPSADLLICPKRADAFPLDQTATIPPSVRSVMIALASAYGAAVDQLDRLIEWHDPGACSAPAK